MCSVATADHHWRKSLSTGPTPLSGTFYAPCFQKTRSHRGVVCLWLGCRLSHTAPSVPMATSGDRVTVRPSPERPGERTNADSSDNVPNPNPASGAGPVHRGAGPRRVVPRPGPDVRRTRGNPCPVRPAADRAAAGRPVRAGGATARGPAGLPPASRIRVAGAVCRSGRPTDARLPVPTYPSPTACGMSLLRSGGPITWGAISSSSRGIGRTCG